MIKTLELTNFRKHKDLTLNLKPGLNCLRGANEQGKTTICEAICYAIFGSKMLRGTFSDAVSYGEAEASLKVKLTLDVDGVEYVITRGKSGAEVATADTLVTGQNETRNYMERVLGYSADTAKLLLVAQQNDVRGVLTSGGSSASSLVEKLANLQLIEEIVDAIQTNLPCGNTKAMEGQVTMAESNLGEAPQPPKKEALLVLQNDLSRSTVREEEIESRTATLSTEIVAVNVELSKAFDSKKQHSQYLTNRDNLKAQAQMPEDPGVTEQDIAKASILLENAETLRKAQVVYKTQFPTIDLSWEGDYESFLKESSETSRAICTAYSSIHELEILKVREEAKIVSEETCQICGKSTSDIASIAEVNAKAAASVLEIGKKIQELKGTKAKLESDLADLKRLENVSNKIRTLATGYFELSDTVPPVPTWIGQPPGDLGEVPDVKAMQKKLNVYKTHLAKAQAAQSQLESLVEPVVVDAGSCEEKLQGLKLEKEKLDLELKEIQALKSKVREAESTYNEQCRSYEKALASHKEAKTTVANLKQALSDMQKHNEIVKVLRNARPEIASKVWGTVLSAVSHYFSQIRGFESPVTKDADSFKVEGKDVENLSGSTLDALGLAIRIALSKVFLPGSGMLFVDEVFAGCDDERELSGLATIAQAGFSQTILITHSDLADAVADNLVVL
jgi:DNA repair exonuclease SbcCD ATPase subunit